jgi:hypothetical protein
MIIHDKDPIKFLCVLYIHNLHCDYLLRENDGKLHQ